MWHQQQPQHQQAAQQQGAQQPMIVVVMPQDQQQQPAAQYQHQYGQHLQTQPVHQQYMQASQLYQQQYDQAMQPQEVVAPTQWQQHQGPSSLPTLMQGTSASGVQPSTHHWQQQQQQQPRQAGAHAWQQQHQSSAPGAPCYEPPYQLAQEPAAPSWQQQKSRSAQPTEPHQSPASGPPGSWQQQRQRQHGMWQQGWQQQQQQWPQPGRQQGGRQPGGQQQKQQQRRAQQQQSRPHQGRQQQIPQQQQQERLQQGQQQRAQQQQGRPQHAQQQQQAQSKGQLGRRPAHDNRQQLQQQVKRQRTAAQPASLAVQQGPMQQQQQQGRGAAGATVPGFDFQQWQQESQRWQTQLQQKRDNAGPSRPPKQQQPGQKRQQQQQQQRNAQQRQAQGGAQQQGKKAAKKQQLQQEPNQPLFPILRLPPKVTAVVANYLTESDRFKLAELLPESSAAVAVLRGGIHSLVLPARKPPRHVDVPSGIGKLKGLQQLSMCLWMDGKIQARTGLSGLSALSNLTSLRLTVDVAPEWVNNHRLGGKAKQGDAAQELLPRQLQEALQDASVKVQEDLWQVTAALGRLTNLKRLQLDLSQYSAERSKDILTHIGYQAFAQISGLTGLESLTLAYSVCQAGSGLEALSALSRLTEFSMEETGAGGTIIAGKQRFYLQADQEAGVAALGRFWRNSQQLLSVRLRTPYLGPEAVGKFIVQPGLHKLDVSGCRLLFPRFRTTFEQLTALQELHVSGCEGLTAADLATAASGLRSSLTYLDIGRNSRQGDGGVMQGSIAAIAQLTNLRHLNAYNTGIAAVGAGASTSASSSSSSSGAVCAVLSDLQQLTFLSIGSVHRDVMTIAVEDIMHLSALTNLVTLHIHGALLGVGLCEPGSHQVDKAHPVKAQQLQVNSEVDLKSALMARLEFLRPLTGLSGTSCLRLWACRFSHINRDRVQGIVRFILNNQKLAMRKHDVLDSKWYPGEAEPAEYTGDEADGTAAAGGNSNAYRGVYLD